MENLPNPAKPMNPDNPIAILYEKAQAACDELEGLLSGTQTEILESLYGASEAGDYASIKRLLAISLIPLDQKVLIVHRVVEPSERQRGHDRMTHKFGRGKAPHRDIPRTRDTMGQILGISGKTYEVAVWVVETAAQLKGNHPDVAKRAIALLNDKSVRSASLYLSQFLAVENLPNPSTNPYEIAQKKQKKKKEGV